jgi:hypothetical protein
LESSHLGKVVLDRMTDESRDDASGQPLFSLLFTLWALQPKYFLARCRVPKESQSDDVSLAVAKCIQNQRPTNSVRCAGKAMDFLEEVLVPKSFDDLISRGEKKEEEARAAVASSKNLLRESSQQRAIVILHLEKLKELQIDFGQARWNTEGYVALDSTLEQSLDYDVKLFSWLVSCHHNVRSSFLVALFGRNISFFLLCFNHRYGHFHILHSSRTSRMSHRSMNLQAKTSVSLMKR